jgi:Fanconi anemia group M protein
VKLRDDDAIALTGKIPSSLRQEVWNGNARIIFATPQIVRNDLESGFLSLKDFSFLVFDECHRARKQYAYTYVAKKYVEQASWPIILGMTASPGADKEKVAEICSALFIEQIEYRSEEDSDVAPYINPIEVVWRRVDLPAEYREIGRTIRSMLAGRLSWLNKIGIIRAKPEAVGRRELLEAGEELRYRLERASRDEKGPIYTAIIAQSASLTLFHALELLETQGIQTLTSFLERIEQQSEDKKSYRTIITDPEYVKLKNLVNLNAKLEHPKMPVLREVVTSQLKQNPKSKVIVFTQYRDTASYIADKLRNDGLSIERFVGQASKPDDPGLSQDEQAEILRSFSNGDTNLLVATCIAEEGLDIPSVDLVVFYEPIPSEIRYIQRKGRTGRRAAGKVVILATNETLDMAYLHSSRRKVQKMRKLTALLNRELNPLMRLGPKPEPDPMTVEEIRDIEKYVQAQLTRARGIESEKVCMEAYHEVDRASGSAQKKIMKGRKDISVDSVIDETVEYGATTDIAKTAIEKVQGREQIGGIGRDDITPLPSIPMPKSSNKAEGDIFDVFVEKVYAGRAFITINDARKAILMPQDFEGPSSIIKKDARFKAKGTFYYDGSMLCFRVREVIQILS